MSLAFFTNINPSFYMGGFVGSSKQDALSSVDDHYKPKTIYVDEFTSIDLLIQQLEKRKISFPVILKPNRGERGKGVMKISSSQELNQILTSTSTDFLIQEFVDYPLEFGVLFYRIPKTNRSGISSICLKILPFVEGDGTKDVFQLIREKFSRTSFENLNDDNKHKILKKGEILNLEYISHRSRGCIFKDLNQIKSKEILKTFDGIAKQLKGFNFGRFDVKTKSRGDLIRGKDIKILEINGANSQPIHIFDPNYSFFKCYKELHAHWRLIYEISKANSKLGFAPASTQTLIKAIIKNGIN